MALHINNEIYHHYGRRWYEAKDDPVALLRAESKLKNPWIRQVLEDHVLSPTDGDSKKMLDVACGAGFLTNYLSSELASRHFEITGLDAAADSLDVARQFDSKKMVQYDVGDAYHLPYKDAEFDAVSCMDFLEHVERPADVVKECSRVLKPGGVFFFHTFARNPISYLIVIKGVEWFVRNTPKNLHIYRLFIQPEEFKKMCLENQLLIRSLRGIRPRIDRAFFKMLGTGEVGNDFNFTFQKSLVTGYIGYAKKAFIH